MNTKHTPGPWVVDRTHPELERNVVWSGDQIIASVVNDQHGNADANARLVAAAPELLEALRYMVANAEAEGWSEMMLADATAAIAKAEGRS